MVPNNAVQPRWFIFWSRLVYLAIALLVLGVLYALPALITPTRQAQTSVIGTTLFGIIIILFLAGSVLGAITLIYGLAANALFLRTHNVLMAVPWRRVTRPLIAVARLIHFLI